MSVKISELSAASALTGTEILVAVQGSETKRTTVSAAGTYINGLLMVATAGTPTTGDTLVAERAGAARRLDLDALSSYAVASAWSGATLTTPAVAGDLVLAQRSGVVRKFDVSTIKSYVLDGVQATTLNISGLSAATLADSDQYLAVQGTTALKTTWAAMAARAHTQFSTFTAALDAVVTVGDTDKLYTLQGTTARYMTALQLANYAGGKVSSTILAAIWTADAVTPVVATDTFALARSGTAKTATAAALGVYTTSLLSGAAAVTPMAAGDKFSVFRSGAAATADIDVVATYIGNRAVSAASTVTTMATGDKLVFDRAGAVTTITEANLKTHLLTGIQATVLDVSALAAATLADAQLVPICDGTVAKQQTLANVAAFVHAGMNAYTLARTDAAPVVDADVFPVARAAGARRITAADLATYMIAEHWDQTAGTAVEATDQLIVSRPAVGYRKATVQHVVDFVTEAAETAIASQYEAAWQLIPTANYTATPDSTSKILMSNTADMAVGLPVRYTYGGTAYYGVVATVTANTEITVRGAPLNVASALTELRVGPPSHVHVERIHIPGAYLVPWHVPDGGATEDLLAEIARRHVAWRHGAARLVAVAVTQQNEDTTAQPKFNVKIDGNLVLTQDSGAGIQVSATAGTWTWSNAVAIDVAQYAIASGDALEVACTASGSDGDACDVSLELVFVYV